LPASRATNVPDEQYKITFMAFTAGTLVDKGEKSTADHASISIDSSGVWGFYPSTQGKLITNQGVLKYNDEYPRAQEYADFFVDARIMGQIREVIAEWEANPPAYIILVNDCVNFLYRICDIIGLQYNNLTFSPTMAVREIRNRNDQNKLYKGQ
jgi:hypothetical protein